MHAFSVKSADFYVQNLTEQWPRLGIDASAMSGIRHGVYSDIRENSVRLHVS